MWDSNPNCGIARERKKKRENYPAKSPNLRHCQALSQNKGLSKYQRRATWLRTGPCPTGDRQAGVGVGGSQSWKGAIAAPQRHPLPNCKQAPLLTKTSWDSGRLTSARRVAARDQLPRRDTRHTWEKRAHSHPENQVAGTQEVIRRTPHLGETVLATHLVTWTARTWEGHKTQAQPSLCHCGVPKNLNLSGLDLGSAPSPGLTTDSSLAEQPRAWKCRPWKHTRSERGQTQCGWDTASTPHTCQWHLFAGFFPLHSRTEQVSINKWPPPPPCVRAEIRHWRDQQTEEAKINRGNHCGSDRGNRLKPCS